LKSRILLSGLCLALSATAYPSAPVETVPARWAATGVPAGNTATGRVEVVFHAPATGEVSRVSLFSGRGGAQVVELEKNRRYAVDFSINAPAAQHIGTVSDQLLIKTGLPESPELSVPLHVSYKPRLRVVPPAILLPIRALGGLSTNVQAVSSFLLLSPGTEGAFEVTKVEWPGSSGTASASPAPRGIWRIDLKGVVPTSSLNGKSMRIHTSLASVPVMEIPIRTTELQAAASCVVCPSLSHQVHPTSPGKTTGIPATIVPPVPAR
jgi:hypothetical protein